MKLRVQLYHYKKISLTLGCMILNLCIFFNGNNKKTAITRIIARMEKNKYRQAIVTLWRLSTRDVTLVVWNLCIRGLITHGAVPTASRRRYCSCPCIFLQNRGGSGERCRNCLLLIYEFSWSRRMGCYREPGIAVWRRNSCSGKNCRHSCRDAMCNQP